MNANKDTTNSWLIDKLELFQDSKVKVQKRSVDALPIFRYTEIVGQNSTAGMDALSEKIWNEQNVGFTRLKLGRREEKEMLLKTTPLTEKKRTMQHFICSSL